MTNMLSNVTNAVAASAPVVQLVCCKCVYCFWVGISQIVIAAFAVVSGCVAIVKFFNDRNKSAPKLDLKFKDDDRFCVVSENDVEQGGRMLTFRLRLDNVGSCPARECKVRIENVFIVSDGKRSEVKLDDSLSTLLKIRQDILKWPLEVNNGDGVDIELCRIAVNMGTKKGVEAHELADENNDAVIQVLNSTGVLAVLLPHQTHVQIEVKVIASLFAPKTYVFDLEWKGRSVLAIGTAASYSVNLKKGH